MKQEDIEQIVLDVITMTEDPNAKCVHSYNYEELDLLYTLLCGVIKNGYKWNENN